MQTFLVAAFFIEVIPGIMVSPGSMVLFTGSLFAVLLIYIREDAIEARKVIYALLAANLVLAALQIIFSWSIMGQHTINVYNLPEDFFLTNSRVLIVGTLVLFMDAFLIIFLYEIISRYISNLFFQIFLTMSIIVSIDSLFFVLGAFAETDMFYQILISGLMAKLSSTLIYSLIFWFYISYIDSESEKLGSSAKPFKDIFHTLTYRQKYEQVYLEKENKSIELKESDIRFRTLFENMALGVTYQNAAGEIIDANLAAQQILGLTLDQMQGKTSMDPHWKAIHEDGSNFPGETHASMVALKTGKEVNNVIMGVFNSKKNDYRWLKVNASPQFRNAEKKPYRVFTTFDDITNEKYAQQSLKELYNKYQNIIHTANIAILELDKNANYTFVNPAWEKLFGYSIHEVLGKNKELILPNDQPTNSLFNKLINGEISNYQIERKYQKKDGKIVWVDSYIAANNDLQGNLNSIVGVMIDITKRKEAEQEIRENERVLREALSKVERSENLLNETGRLAKVGAWELDLETMTPYFSDETYRIHELPIGNPPKVEDGLKFYALEAQQIIKNAFIEAVENHVPYDLELPFITANKKNIWVRTHGQVEVKNGKAVRLFGAIQDITALKESTLRLRESREKYKNLVEYSHDVIWAIDSEGSFTFFNSASKIIYGYEPDELIGKPFFQFIPKEHIQKEIETFQELVNNKQKLLNYESQFTHKDGHIVSTLSNARILLDDSGNFIGATGISKDITERKLKEDELKKSEERFRAIVEGAPDPIFIQANKCFVYLNKLAVELFGAKDEKELLGKPVLDYFHPDFHKKAEERIKSLNIDKKRVHEPFEQILIQVTGNEVWVETKGQPIFYDGAHGGLVFVRNVTARKLTENELRESKGLLESIHNNLPGAIIQYKLFPDGTDALIYVNNRSKDIWGITPQEAMENNNLIWNQIDDEYIMPVKKSIQVSFEELNPWKIEFKNNLSDGSVKWIEGIGIPNKREDGSVVWDSIMLDVTSRKNTEIKMNQYKNSLQKLTTELMLAEEKQRKKIAANIHDHLSQSLVISKMKLNDLWNDIETNERQNEIGTVIKHISEALENSRKITYDLCPPVLYELGLIEAIYWLAEKIEDQNQIKVKFETDFNDIKLSEPKLILIYRAIQEILNNAIKHSGANQINIRFTKYEYGLQIIIKDEGSGFDKSQLNSRSLTNSGFGLFAVRERIENLEGTFIINSTLGFGTEVKIFVPLKVNKLL
nr:PAS domain S-box protein [Confluentibacter lentus]